MERYRDEQQNMLISMGKIGNINYSFLNKGRVIVRGEGVLFKKNRWRDYA
jgi:hypothetical protein